MNDIFVTFFSKQTKRLPSKSCFKGDLDPQPEKVTVAISPPPKYFSDSMLRVDKHVQKEGLHRQLLNCISWRQTALGSNPGSLSSFRDIRQDCQTSGILRCLISVLGDKDTSLQGLE